MEHDLDKFFLTVVL